MLLLAIGALVICVYIIETVHIGFVTVLYSMETWLVVCFVSFYKYSFLTHSLTHSVTLTRSLTHSLTHSLGDSLPP
eukprot:SAG11_NODE_27053_length_337_cov_1.298319_1_plen_75_part_10